MPVSIGFPRVLLTRFLDQHAGDVAMVEILEAGLHVGTHVDASFQFIPGAAPADEIGPLALSGSAVVVDAPGGDDWISVGRDELLDWERRSGERIGRDDVVHLRTGHPRWWRDIPDGSEYLTRPWPHLVQSAADLLVERGVRALGVGCADPDRVDQRDLGSATFELHRRLLGAGIQIIENLANLAARPRWPGSTSWHCRCRSAARQRRQSALSRRFPHDRTLRAVRRERGRSRCLRAGCGARLCRACAAAPAAEGPRRLIVDRGRSVAQKGG